MKKLYTLLFITFAGATFAQQSLPFSDTFSYLAGNLHETTPWSALGTPNATDHILLDGSKATFAGGGTDAQVTITPQTSGTVFYRINLNITSMAGVTDTNGGYIMGFAQNATAFGGTLWAKRVDDTNFNIGIETRTATGAPTTYTAAAYPTGTSITVVVAYTFGAGASDDTTRLWINPTTGDEATPLLTDTHAGTDLPSIASFFLRQDSPTETGVVEIDNLKVSLTFTEVLSSSSFNAIDGLTMYPNPLKGNTLYFTSTANADMSVQIYDVLGKEVVNSKVMNNTVNVSSLNAGVYMVKVTEEGKTATRKLVIQ
jgi:hypothetical protein